MRRNIIFAIAVLGVLSISCKKDKNNTATYKSMSGDLSVGTEMLSFVNPGDKFDFVSSGVTIPESETDKTVERVYTYKDSEKNKKDTIDKYSVVIPDIVGEYKVTATAEAKGYYTKTKVLTTTVVSGKSLTSCDKSSLAQIQDLRDSKHYRTTVIGGRTWMADNLAYFEKDAEGKYTLGNPYSGVKATEDVFGGFYSWGDARKACPSGWRIPTIEEWNALGESAGDLMCDAYYNGGRLWEFWPEVKKTNKHNFFAMPFGYATIVDGEYTFTGFNDYAFYWADDAGKPVCKYIYVSNPKVIDWPSASETDFAAQLRCIKE